MKKKSARGPEPRPQAERLACALAPGLLWLVAFVIFLRHHDYGLWRADAAIGALWVLAAGLLPGVAMALSPRVVRAALFALVVLVFLDLQTGWIREPTSAIGACVAFAVVGFVANEKLGRATAFLSAVMIASTLPLSPGDGWIHLARPEAKHATVDESRAASPPPPILHLVLDEHVSTAGIPPAFDRDRRLRDRMEAGYVERGFRLFSHGFSRHYTTGPSLSHVLNLSAGRDSLAFYDPERGRVTRNAWFRILRKRGYQIRVFQTDHLDLCHPEDGEPIRDCTTYALESIKAIETSGLDRPDRTRALLGSFGQLSHWNQRARRAFAQRARERGDPNAHWPLRAGRLSAVSSREMLPRIEAALAATRPGQATLAHLLLPHFPYAYDAECALRPSPLAWRSYKGEGLRGLHNDPASRAERYPLYLEQLSCTQKLVGGMLDRLLARDELREAIFIVHGDHGSRLNLVTPVAANLERLSDRDFVDAFATHFAVRAPGLEGGVDSRGASLDALLRAVVERRTIPDDDGWIGSQKVHLVGERRDQVISHVMPWPAR